MRPRNALTLLACLLCLESAVAQGTILFANRVPQAGIDASVYDGITGIPLEGPWWLAQLYAGSANSESSLSPVGSPTPFQTGQIPGYWEPVVVAVPGIGEGEKVWLQAHVWSSWFGATWEDARAKPVGQANGLFGSSLPLVDVLLGGSEPTPMVGLESFAVFPIPEPSSMWLIVMGLCCLVMWGKVR
jgi:hypothetical protein